MLKGICSKWKHTYGFLKDENGTEYFVHESRIKMDGRRNLVVGQPYLFEPVDNPPEGMMGVDVRPAMEENEENERMTQEIEAWLTQ